MGIAFKLSATAVALIIGNGIYAAFGSHDWASAWERSFFQAAALLAAWFTLRSA